MTTTPIEMLATITVLGVVVKAVVDALRRQFPALDGLIVQGVAWALGAVVAWAFSIKGTAALLEFVGAPAARVPIEPIDYLITGAAIAAGAGALAELAGRAKQPPAVVEVNATGERI